MNTRQRPAFTLIELLVILAVVFFLLGLILPFISRLREAAARTESQNNMKQLGIGCHAYADVNKHFPSGVDKNGYSALAHLLPYIEQAALFQQINFNVPVTDKANNFVRQTRIAIYTSPLDPLSGNRMGTAATNYFFCAGTQHALKGNNGVFYRESKIQFRRITDGTSNTVMIGETLIGDGGKQAKDVRRQHVQLDAMALKVLNPNTGVQEFKNNKKIIGNRGSSWLDGKFLQTTFSGTRSLNDAKPDVNCGGVGGLSALRSLSKTINVGMCDGSVRAINQNIAMQTWHAVCTRSGGEVVFLN